MNVGILALREMPAPASGEPTSRCSVGERPTKNGTEGESCRWIPETI
jgi:hypothetical protein